MKKWFLLTINIILCLSTITGCWNYREIENLMIVGGVAIDKGEDDQYLITVETIQAIGGKESKNVSKQFSMSGKTIFDAVRNEISITGKRLYWSHTKVVILSEQIAKEGILQFLDWFQRDSETRADINILISKEKTAREILLGKSESQEIISLALDDTLKNQESLSKSPTIEVWEVMNDIEEPGITAILPIVTLKGKSPKIMGTAIFNKDKLIGFLDSTESQNLLFIRDKIKGGLLVVGKNEDFLPVPVSMEIFKSKTKIKPIFNGDDIIVNINIDLTLNLDEIAGDENYIDERKLKDLENNLEKMLSNRIEDFIKYIQSVYGVDIFGFGSKIRDNDIAKWKRIEHNWQNKLKEVTVNVTSKIRIEGSGLMAEPLKMGD